MAEVWTIKAALDWCRGYLERKGDENPRLSAEWLLAEACGLRRVELYVNFDRPLTPEERDVLRDYVARRGAGEPLQYITGEVAFRHIAVKVRPGVLIPRPETEVLVSEALSLLPAPHRRHATDSSLTEDEAQALLLKEAAHKAAAEELGGDGSVVSRDGASAADEGLDGADADRALADITTDRHLNDAKSTQTPSPDPTTAEHAPLYVADICTGSGCIACSVAYEHPDARVLATDIAPEALALARENVEALGLSERVYVLNSNLGDAIPARFMGKLDLVVSNPPYIPTSVMTQLPHEVGAFEPSLALDGGADGLDLFRPLTAWAARALKPGGGYAVELHETCLDDAAAIAREAGFVDVRVVNDLADRPRVLVARTPR